MKKIYLLGLASIVALSINAQTMIKVNNRLTGKKENGNVAARNVGTNSVQRVTGSLTCNTLYVAGTTMDLSFTLNLTNTDDEYCDSLALTFPVGITPNSSPNNPLITPSINASATGTQLNAISGQTISWGTDDDANKFGGIPTGRAINFTVNVTIDAGISGNQVAAFHADGDSFGGSPGDLDGTFTIYPVGAQLVDLFVMGVRPSSNIDLDRTCGLGLDTVLTLVKNIGNTTESNIVVNYSVNGVNAGSTVIPGPLAPGDSTFAFFLPAYDFMGTGSKTLKAWVAQVNDIALANDTVTEGFFNSEPTALTNLTYTNGIEPGNDLNSLLIYGNAAPFTGISTGTKRSGAQALFTTVNASNGGTVGNTYSYQLILPCMDVVQGETYSIVYWRRTNGTATNANGQTAVFTGTEPTTAGMTTQLKAYSPITTFGTWLKDSVFYTATATETRYFSISGKGTVSSTSQMNVRIDDISIRRVACVNSTIDTTICGGTTFTLGNSVYSTSGTYYNLFPTSNSCDSVVFTNLTVLPQNIRTQNITICAGDSIVVGNSVYNTSNTYTNVFTAANNCDSTVVTNLTVLPQNIRTQNITICAGDSIIVGNNVYNTSNTYTDVFAAANNCDSTVITNLTVLPQNIRTQNIYICDGGIYSIGTSTYSIAGTYSDVLTAVNGCDSTVITNLIVNSLPSLTTAPSILSATCGVADGSITGIIVSGNGSLTYLWENSSNDSVGSASDLTNVFAGLYNLQVTDTNACTVTFGPYSISNPGAPIAPIISINDSTVCEGSTIILSANTNGSNIVYQWNGPGGFTSNNASDTISSALFANNGVFAVTVEDTTTNCVSLASLINVTVYQLPVVSVTAANLSVCIGSTTNVLTGSPVNGTFSGIGVTGSNFNASVAGVGSQNITYTYTDVNGCTSSATATVVVNALPSITFTVSDATVCADQTAQALTATPSGGLFSGIGVTGSNFNASVAGVGSQIITYSYIDNNGCSSSATDTIVVNALPVVSVTAANDSACVNQNTLTLSGIPAGGTFSGSGVTGSNFNAFIAGLGTKVVTYSYTDNNGCSNTATTSIIVDACVGINELVNNETVINVYPNPANDNVNIYVSTMNNKLTFAVYNSVGQLVKLVKSSAENLINNNTISFSTDNIINGFYFVKVYDNNGFSKTIRLVINK